MDTKEKNIDYQFPLEVVDLLLKDMTTGKSIIVSVK